MRKFFERLANAGKRAWNWLKGTRPARFATRCYDTATLATARPVMWLYYGGRGRQRVFANRWGKIFVWGSWEIVIVTTAVFVAAWQGVKAVGRGARKTLWAVTAAVLLLAALIWAVLSVVFTFALALVTWALNTTRNLLVRGWQHVWSWVTDTELARRLTRYASFREVLAYDLGLLTRLHAGGARLSRRVIGDRPTYWMVTKTANAVARLHPPTYDALFDHALPYDTPDNDLVGVFVYDGPDSNDLESPPTEADKVAAFFVSSGFVLLSEDVPSETERDIFNEYVLERWANLNAAEIATDEFGRTWAVPRVGQPLFRAKNVATSAEETRFYADNEIDWMSATDPVAKSYSFGRHWAAALADQDEHFLSDSTLRSKERALCYSKIKGRQDLLAEHVLRGFDEFVAVHVALQV